MWGFFFCCGRCPVVPPSSSSLIHLTLLPSLLFPSLSPKKGALLLAVWPLSTTPHVTRSGESKGSENPGGRREEGGRGRS